MIAAEMLSQSAINIYISGTFRLQFLLAAMCFDLLEHTSKNPDQY
jgi:hypothetical protein